MACHQHRCCRRPAATDARSLDYVLLAAHEDNVIEGAATMLRGAGASSERHALGLRLNSRGANWQAGLTHLADTLAPSARRGLRVALIPIGANDAAFQKALLMSQPLDTFVASLASAKSATCTPATVDNHFLGDVFKGDSLE